MLGRNCNYCGCGLFCGGDAVNYLSVCSGIEAGDKVRRDISGVRNGRLVAVSPVGRSSDGHVTWLCKCDCGGEKIVQSNNMLREAGTKSCGCLRKVAAQKRLLENGAWNDGKSYAINNGERLLSVQTATERSMTNAIFKFI